MFLPISSLGKNNFLIRGSKQSGQVLAPPQCVLYNAVQWAYYFTGFSLLVKSWTGIANGVSKTKDAEDIAEFVDALVCKGYPLAVALSSVAGAAFLAGAGSMK